jgi:hypothetical protein
MKSTLEYPPVTQETLDEVVRRILGESSGEGRRSG